MPRKCSFAKGKFHRIAHLLDRSPCHPPRFLDKKKTPRFSRTLSAILLSIAVVSLRPKLAGAPYRTLPRCIFGSQAFRGASAHHGRDFFIRKIRRIFRAVFRKISSGAQKLHVCLPCFTIHGTLASVFVVLPYRALVSTPHAYEPV